MSMNIVCVASGAEQMDTTTDTEKVKVQGEVKEQNGIVTNICQMSPISYFSSGYLWSSVLIHVCISLSSCCSNPSKEKSESRG